MQHDQRQRTDRRVTDQWARRMRALEREFERADRARRPRVERHSVPLAVLSGAVVLLVAVLILVTTRGGGTADTAQKQQPAPDAFAPTPASHWQAAAQGLTLPTATPAGPLSARTVQSLLEAARTRLVAAHTDARVLAPGNSLAAPVRANGRLTFAFVPAAAGHAARLDVSVNVVWAYALRATYAQAEGGAPVVAVHERAELQYPLTSRAAALDSTARPVKDTALWFDADCGYRAGGLVGLPRADDPDALPGYGNGVSVDQAFALTTTSEISGHVCRG